MRPADLLPAGVKRRLKRLLGRPETRLHPDWSIVAPAGPVTTPHTIFDVGAHEGWFFHCWKDWCPAARVHAFEPSHEPLERARTLYADGTIVFNEVAVGATPGRLTMNVYDESPVSNSLMPIVKSTWDAIGYPITQVRQREVEIVTLDRYRGWSAVGDVHLIKIDVQGFELEVLRGATATLRATSYVLVESAMLPLYEGAPRFTDVYDFMADHGFHLIGMRAWHRGNRTLVETDMLFRRNDLMPPIDRGIDRVYVDVAERR
jgi:FkbM family methyltransferase